MNEIVVLSLCLGAVAGFLAGLLGIGGGLVIVPALVALFSWQAFPPDLMMLMALATSLATIIFTAMASIWAHHRLGGIAWPIVLRLLPSIVLGTVSGSVIAEHLSTITLCWICAVYMIVVGLQMAFKHQPKITTGRPVSVGIDLVVGLVIGGMSALVGIGGGTLSVPYLLGRGQSMKNAVAISSVCGFPIALVGTISYMYLGWYSPLLPVGSVGYVYMPAFLSIISLSILTAPLGAKVSHKIPAQQLKQIFSLVLFGAAFKLIWY